MAELKRQTFFFSNGKQIKLYGTGFGITRSFEIGEASAPNIFHLREDEEDGKPFTVICNPYRLTKEELLELADFMIRVCMDFKENVRKYDATNPKVFNKESTQVSEDNKPEPAPKKEGKAAGGKENNKEKAGNADRAAGSVVGPKEQETGKNTVTKQLSIDNGNEK